MNMDIEAIKDANPIEEVVQETGGFNLRGRGKYLKPDGEEGSSLVVNTDDQLYNWNAKGHAGDVISWLENTQRVSFEEALAWLAERAGIPLKMDPETKRRLAAKRERTDVLTIIMEWLHQKLLDSSAATAYAEGRGWTMETVEAARPGLWDGDVQGLRELLQLHEIDVDHPVAVALTGYSGNLHEWARKWGLNIHASWIKKGRVPGIWRGEWWLYGHWAGSRCEYISGRAMGGNVEKQWAHWNPPRELMGDKQPYWNAAVDRDAHYCVVVEGQACADSLAQWGVPGVALAGLNEPTALARQLAAFEQVYIGLDADEAAEKALMKPGVVRELVERLAGRARIVTWPDHDVNDWLQGDGNAAKCRVLLGKAPPLVLWLARRYATAEPLERDRWRRQALQVAVNLDAMALGVWRDELLDSKHLDMSVGAFNQATKALKTDRGKAVRTKVHRSAADDDDVMVRGALLKEAADHEGHAQCALALYPDHFAFVPQWGWLAYDGKMWVQDGAQAIVERAITDTLRRRQRVAYEKDYQDLVKATGASHPNVAGTRLQLQSAVTVTTDEFDNDPDLLNVANGVLNLRTGQLVAHEPSQRFTYCLEVPYEPDANDVEWLAWLCETVADDDENNVVRWLQEVVGYSLTGHTREDAFFYLYGPTRSGKGTFLNTLLALMGKPLAATVDITSFTSERTGDTNNFDLAPLKASRLVVASESKAHKRLNEEKLKQMTGEDEIRAAFKNQTHFEYKPQFKIFMASNWALNMNADDDAAWGRARVLHFPHSYLGREDRSLKTRMTRLENLKGVLAWAVEGVQRWYERGELETPALIADLTDRQRHEQDLVGIWLAERCDVAEPDEADIFTPTEMLMKDYKEWCKDGGMRPKGMPAFKRALEVKGYEKTKRRHPQFENPRVGYNGIRLVGHGTQNELTLG